MTPTDHTAAPRPLSVLMIGATGAVGSEVVRALLPGRHATTLTLLGRRTERDFERDGVSQHIVDLFAPASYGPLLEGHDSAVCTFGVGEPSAMSKADFIRIDRDAVVAFASACREAGVGHFELLGSVGADSRSRSFYLRSKGELEDALRALSFPRLSLFQPSMILTERNRYGLTQAMTLAVWPRLDPILRGGLRKFRGIRVEELGRAMAANVRVPGTGTEVLRWDDFKRLSRLV
jgi:uncharacterized protein YbjT (DUF2867 family)